jgi:DNA-binding transcriptional LysR family regulator
VLIEHAQQIQSVVFSSTRHLDALNNDLSGDLSLSIPVALGEYLLLDAIATFAERHPLIKLNIFSSYSLVDLNKNEADVVVRGTANPPEHLVGHRLFPYYICGYSHKAYLSNTPRENIRWITMPFEQHPPLWIQQTQFKDVPVGIQVSDITLRYLAMSQGKELSRAACYMADTNTELTRLPESVPEPVADLWILTHPDKRKTPKIKALMKHLYDAINAKKALITGQTYPS